MAAEEKAQIAVRLAGNLLSRLDAYKDRVKGECKGGFPERFQHWLFALNMGSF